MGGASSVIPQIQEHLLSEGYTMYIDGWGNKAVNYVVSAYANGGRDELRNTLVHVRNVNAEDYQRMAGENGTPWWPEECITREQTIESLTINIARQMLIDNERGSVSTGKYADFLLVNKDVLTCPVTEIHEAKPVATYFEGKKVFAQTHEDKSREFE